MSNRYDQGPWPVKEPQNGRKSNRVMFLIGVAAIVVIVMIVVIAVSQ